MSSRYRRFLLSTCLPAMAVALCASAPSFAGFEWTPPEKTVDIIEVGAPDFEERFEEPPGECFFVDLHGTWRIAQY